MPTYEFYNKDTGEEFEVFMKISEREEYLKNNPHITPRVSAPAIISGSGSYQKAPSGFNEVLSKVAEAHPNSEVGRKHGKKSIKQIKTDQIVQKHVKKITQGT